MQKLIITLLMFSLILPNSSLAQQDQSLNIAENSDKPGEIGKKFLEFLTKAFKEVWKEAVKIWQKMWEWFKEVWNEYILGWIKDVWQNILDFFKEVIIKRFNRMMK